MQLIHQDNITKRIAYLQLGRTAFRAKVIPAERAFRAAATLEVRLLIIAIFRDRRKATSARSGRTAATALLAIEAFTPAGSTVFLNISLGLLFVLPSFTVMQRAPLLAGFTTAALSLRKPDWRFVQLPLLLKGSLLRRRPPRF